MRQKSLELPSNKGHMWHCTAALHLAASPAWPQGAVQVRQLQCHSTPRTVPWTADGTEPTQCWAQQLWGGVCSHPGTPTAYCNLQPPAQPVLSAHLSHTGSCCHSHCPGLPPSAPATCTPGVPSPLPLIYPKNQRAQQPLSHPHASQGNRWHFLGAAPCPSTNRKHGVPHFTQVKHRELTVFSLRG